MQPPQQLEPPPPQPYRKIATAYSLILNAAFFYFCWLFFSKLFKFGQSGLTYIRPTDLTPWLLLPVFVASTALLGSNIIYQYQSRKKLEVYFAPVFALNLLQCVASILVIAFIVNALGCFAPTVFGISVC